MNDTRTEPPHIYEAIRNVMAKVTGVAKAGEFRLVASATQPTYRFQKYDDMADALGTAFREQDVMIQGKIIDLIQESWDRHKDGGTQRWCRVILRKAFIFTSLRDGSHVEMEAAGEGSGNDDKATNKAETGAIKNALKQAFLLSTRDEEDPDAIRPDDTGHAVDPVEDQAWRFAEDAVRQYAQADLAKESHPEVAPEQIERAQKAIDAGRKCQTTGDLYRLLDWAIKGDLLTVAIGDQPLAARLLAAKGVLPVGPPTVTPAGER